MGTKTFSSRADEAGLAYADLVTRERFGMSFGKYCGSVLIEAIGQGAELPRAAPDSADEQKEAALRKLKSFAKRPHDESVGRMSDEQIRDLISSRYE